MSSTASGKGQSIRREACKPRRGRIRTPGWMLPVAAAVALAAVWVTEDVGTGRGAAEPPSAAAELAEKTWLEAESRLRAAKTAAGLVVETSPLIGAEMTPLVTTLGSLEAKREASRPGWAPVLVAKLAARGVGRGSVVAAGVSGSFPGLNLALAAACQALDAELIAVSSVTASNWGANQPGFTWPEIEERLVREGILRRASAAVSPGGGADAAADLEPHGRSEALRIQVEVCLRMGIEPLLPVSLHDSIEQRMRLYDRLARGRRIALYANIGGSEPSLGRSAVILRFRSGFLPDGPFDLSKDRGVMARFAERGVPVLSLLNVEDLSRRWQVR